MRPNADEHVQVQVRVRAEFHEMPGLRLTPVQAARLFSLDPARCERVMNALIDNGVLALRNGSYMRADSGRQTPTVAIPRR